MTGIAKKHEFYEFHGRVFTAAERDEWIENEVEMEFDAAEKRGEFIDVDDEAWYRLELFYEFVPITPEEARVLRIASNPSVTRRVLTTMRADEY